MNRPGPHSRIWDFIQMRYGTRGPARPRHPARHGAGVRRRSGARADAAGLQSGANVVPVNAFGTPCENGRTTRLARTGSTPRENATPGLGHSAVQVRDLAWTRPCVAFSVWRKQRGARKVRARRVCPAMPIRNFRKAFAEGLHYIFGGSSSSGRNAVSSPISGRYAHNW